MVTVTTGPTTPAAPPADQADKETCRALAHRAAVNHRNSGRARVIPAGMTITSPEVRANPDWTAGVTKASLLYQQASGHHRRADRQRYPADSADLSATAAAAPAHPEHRLRHLRPRQWQHHDHIHRNRKRDGTCYAHKPQHIWSTASTNRATTHPGRQARLRQFPPPLSDASPEADCPESWPAATGASSQLSPPR